jgi:hypothetical protein
MTSTPTERFRQHAEEYSEDAEDERPLGAYTILLASYLLVVVVLSFSGRKRLPGTLAPSDLALGAVATFIGTRTVTKHPIASPLRMPFTKFAGVSGPSELHEDVRASGWRHAVGELLTCPFCLSQWTATTLVTGIVVAPKLTRTVMSLLSIVGAADFLQVAYTWAIKQAEGVEPPEAAGGDQP